MKLGCRSWVPNPGAVARCRSWVLKLGAVLGAEAGQSWVLKSSSWVLNLMLGAEVSLVRGREGGLPTSDPPSDIKLFGQNVQDVVPRNRW